MLFSYHCIIIFLAESKANTDGSSPEKQAEEGRMMRLLQISKDATSNYPVAKPFSVSNLAKVP